MSARYTYTLVMDRRDPSRDVVVPYQGIGERARELSGRDAFNGFSSIRESLRRKGRVYIQGAKGCASFIIIDNAHRDAVKYRQELSA